MNSVFVLMKMYTTRLTFGKVFEIFSVFSLCEGADV